MLDLTKKQKWSIQESNARINIWHGSVRSGKTWATLVRWILFVAEYKSSKDLLLVGKTNRTIFRNIIVPLKELVGNACKYFAGKGEAYLFGKRMHVIGANDRRSEHKIRGMTGGGLLGDEVTLWPMDFLRMALTRLSVTGAQAFLTTNTDSPEHELKKEYIDREGQINLRQFHFVLDDNTKLDRAWRKEIKKEYHGLWRRRFINGEWVPATGAIYGIFDPSVHGIKIVYDKREAIYIIGSDYGTTNPTVFLKVAFIISKDSGEITAVVEDEKYHDSNVEGFSKSDTQYRKDLEDFTRDVKEQLLTTVLDPSAASLKVELEQHGFNVTLADNSVMEGICFTYNMFANNRLFIDTSKCPKLTGELVGYVWSPRGLITGIERPEKVRDHGPDALRYIMQTMLNNPDRGFPINLIGSIKAK